MAKAAEEMTDTQVNAARLKALQATIDKIEKDFGKGTIMKLGDQPDWDASQVIPSGSIALDHALGIGGYPKGRIIEIYGPESSGKTTLAIHAIAQAQKNGGIAAIIDAEHAFDRSYAKALGVNLETLLISQPDNGEQAWKSRTTSSAAAPWISWSSTRWPPSPPRRKLKAKWAKTRSASRPAS